MEPEAILPQRPPPPAAPLREGADGPRVLHPSCPYCHADVRPNELQPFGCASCLAWSHLACWEEHGSCAACGHSPGPVPAKAARRSGSAPASPRPGVNSGRRQDGEPWWVGRTSHCSKCSAAFVVTNRYKRFECPSCSTRYMSRGMLLFVLLLALYVILNVVFTVLLNS